MKSKSMQKWHIRSKKKKASDVAIIFTY